MSAIEKVVVLARGLGTRMRKADESATLDPQQEAVAQTGVKALIPIGGTGRPFLDYVLHAIADAGFTQVCLVIGPEHQAVRQYYGGDPRPRRISISFAIQAKPQGTADAVAAAEGFAAKDGFLMINSDNLYPATACEQLRNLNGCGVALFERDALLRGGAGNIAPDRVMKFAVGMIDAKNHLRRIIEKPDEATLRSLGNDLYVSMNCWRFGPSIFDACRKIDRSPRGEYEITDAVQYAIDRLGEEFTVVRSREAVLDLSSRADVAAVASLLGRQEVAL